MLAKVGLIIFKTDNPITTGDRRMVIFIILNLISSFNMKTEVKPTYVAWIKFSV